MGRKSPVLTSWNFGGAKKTHVATKTRGNDRSASRGPCGGAAIWRGSARHEHTAHRHAPSLEALLHRFFSHVARRGCARWSCGYRPRKEHRYPSSNPIKQQATPFVDSSIHYADASHQCAGQECPEAPGTGCPIVHRISINVETRFSKNPNGARH